MPVPKREVSLLLFLHFLVHQSANASHWYGCRADRWRFHFCFRLFLFRFSLLSFSLLLPFLPLSRSGKQRFCFHLDYGRICGANFNTDSEVWIYVCDKLFDFFVMRFLSLIRWPTHPTCPPLPCLLLRPRLPLRPLAQSPRQDHCHDVLLLSSIYWISLFFPFCR